MQCLNILFLLTFGKYSSISAFVYFYIIFYMCIDVSVVYNVSVEYDT